MAGKDISFKVSAKDEASGTLNKVAGSVNSFSKETKEALKPLDNLNKSFTSLQKVFNPLTVGITAGIAAISKMSKALNELTDAWAANQSAMKRVDFATTVNRSLAGTSNALKDLATNISKASNGWFEFGDVLGSMSDMLYDKTYDQIEAITTAAADLAVATGTDLQSAVTQLNNTFSGTVGTLGKMIPELKTLTKEQLEAGDAVRIVAERVKGASSAMSDSIEGTKKAAKDAADSLKSALGEAFSYLTQPMTNFFTDMKNKLAELIQNANKVKLAMRQVASEDAQTRYDAANTLRNDAFKRRQNFADTLRTEAQASGLTDESAIWNFINGNVSYQSIVADITRYSATMDEAAVELKRLNTEGLINAEVVSDITVAVSEGVSEGLAFSFNNGQNGTIGAWDVDLRQGLNLAAAGTSSGWTDTDDRRRNAGSLGTGETWDSGLFKLLIPEFKSLGKSVASVVAILDPVNTILSSMMQVLGPALNEILAPIVGILATIGQTIGQVLLPLLDVLNPVIKAISDAFIWFYNKVIRPVGNAIISLFNMVYNAVAAVANGLIAIYNAIPFVSDMSYISYKSLDEGHLGEINTNSLTSAGSSYIGSMGAGASYTAARDVTVNITYSHSFVNGDEREIARQIKKELEAINALGY